MNLKTLLFSLINSSQLSFLFELEDIKLEDIKCHVFWVGTKLNISLLNSFDFVFDIQQIPFFAPSFMPFVIGHSEIWFDALPRLVWLSVSSLKSST